MQIEEGLASQRGKGAGQRLVRGHRLGVCLSAPTPENIYGSAAAQPLFFARFQPSLHMPVRPPTPSCPVGWMRRAGLSVSTAASPTTAITCPHGGLLPQVGSMASTKRLAVTERVWTFLRTLWDSEARAEAERKTAEAERKAAAEAAKGAAAAERKEAEETARKAEEAEGKLGSGQDDVLVITSEGEGGSPSAGGRALKYGVLKCGAEAEGDDDVMITAEVCGSNGGGARKRLGNGRGGGAGGKGGVANGGRSGRPRRGRAQGTDAGAGGEGAGRGEEAGEGGATGRGLAKGEALDVVVVAEDCAGGVGAGATLSDAAAPSSPSGARGTKEGWEGVRNRQLVDVDDAGGTGARGIADVATCFPPGLVVEACEQGVPTRHVNPRLSPSISGSWQ